MAKNPLWRDEYWLLLLQLYLRKPVGLKPMYSRGIVDLALELHLHPRYLYERMFRLRQLDTPMLQRLWERYGDNPGRLKRATRLLRHMHGFGQAERFYDGVEVNETFERDWRPLEQEPQLTMVKLVLILDLYFRLTTITMVRTTPEIIDLGRLIKTKPEIIEEALRFGAAMPTSSPENSMRWPHNSKNTSNEKRIRPEGAADPSPGQRPGFIRQW